MVESELKVALHLVCTHGHVDPRIFADPDYQFGSPTELLLVPDHYVFRMLYSQGIALEKLGVKQGCSVLHNSGIRQDVVHIHAIIE
jgi:hypothetical protein